MLLLVQGFYLDIILMVRQSMQEQETLIAMDRIQLQLGLLRPTV
jgi:hypothetical protein